MTAAACARAPRPSHLERHLAALAPHVPPQLVASGSLEPVTALAAALPRFRNSVIECRLADGAAQVDFSVKYMPRDLRDVQFAVQQPAWEQLERFRGEWVRKTTFVHEAVHMLGLEFDLPRTPAPAMIPSPFFCSSAGDAAATLRLADALLVTFGAGRRGAVLANLERCVRVLPHGARINYLALMLARPGAGVRVGVQGIEQHRAVAYLHAAGWDGPAGALSEFVAGLPAELGRRTPVIAFDVADALAPRVGLEYLLAHDDAHDARSAPALLDHLVARGLCTPAKRDAALRWNASHWFARFTGAASGVERTLSHVKIVCAPDGVLDAKCYLEAGVA